MKNTARQIELSEVEEELLNKIQARENIKATMAIQARQGNREAAWIAKHL